MTTLFMMMGLPGSGKTTLAHRLVLRPEAWIRGITQATVVTDCLGSVPTPTALTDADRAAAGSAVGQPPGAADDPGRSG